MNYIKKLYRLLVIFFVAGFNVFAEEEKHNQYEERDYVEIGRKLAPCENRPEYISLQELSDSIIEMNRLKYQLKEGGRSGDCKTK